MAKKKSKFGKRKAVKKVVLQPPMAVEVPQEDLLLGHKAKCRLCFQPVSKFRVLKSITDNVRNKFFDLTNIELKATEKYSKYICKPCFELLEKSSDFRREIIDNQQKLYAFEGEPHSEFVKAEPIVTGAIELQEIDIVDVLPKTEVFENFWAELKNSEEARSEIESRSSSPDAFEVEDNDELSIEMADIVVPNSEIKAVPKDDVELSCDVCGSSIKGRRNLMAHMSLHDSPAPVAVERGGKYLMEDLAKAVKDVIEGRSSVYRASKNYNIPISTVRLNFLKQTGTIGNERFKCSFCEKTYADDKSRQDHEKAKHLAEEGEFPCEKCNKIYSTQQKLDSHNYNSHKRRSYRCKECGKVYDRQQEYQIHRLEHKEEIACHICGEMIKEGFKMTIHLRRHKKDRQKSAEARPRFDLEFICDFCGSTIKGKRDLIAHMSLHVDLPTEQGTRNYLQRDLDAAVEDVVQGRSSMYRASKNYNIPISTIRLNFLKKTEEAGYEHFDCSYCEKTFKNDEARRDHEAKKHVTDLEELKVKLFVNKRTEEGVLTTDQDIENYAIRVQQKRKPKDRIKITNEWVKDFRERHSDMRTELNSNDELCCDICGFCVEGKQNMRVHMSLHDVDAPKRVRQASTKYKRHQLIAAVKDVLEGKSSYYKASKRYNVPISTLRVHYLKEANGNVEEPAKNQDKIFKCTFCEKSFRSDSNRRGHEAYAHLAPRGEFPCKICDKICSTKRNLQNHFYHRHQKLSLECKDCGLVFDNPQVFRYHSLEHKDEVACHVCGKLVKEGFKMTIHMRQHRDQLYKCPFENCSKEYRNKGMLKSHIQVSHEPRQNLKCPECEATFTCDPHLKKHLYKIHGDRKYKCTLEGCSYKTYEKGYFRTHIRNHKGIDYDQKKQMLNNLQLKN